MRDFKVGDHIVAGPDCSSDNGHSITGPGSKGIITKLSAYRGGRGVLKTEAKFDLLPDNPYLEEKCYLIDLNFFTIDPEWLHKEEFQDKLVDLLD